MQATIDPRLGRPGSTLDLVFGFDAGHRSGRGVGFIILAIALHGAITFAVGRAPARVAEATAITEVELPPPPEPEKVDVPPAQPDDAKVEAAKPSVVPPPAAARAGALLTADPKSPAAKDDALVDFVTDPAGTSYGSGVVARGGLADRGERGATAAGTGSAPAPVVAAPADALVSAANLSRRARLDEPNACAGFYPRDADADSGAVTLTLVVRADGSVASSSVVSETPPSQGFGKAARSCLLKKRFEPSLDRSGNAVAAATTIKVSFVR